MKRTILLICCVYINITALKAGICINEVLPPIEGTYLEYVLQTQETAYSAFTDRDYLMTTFLIENQKKFRPTDIMNIKQNLDNMSAKQLWALHDLDFKDPTTSIILSILVGGLGIDRFYIGDIGLGVAKLLTGGGLGLWWLIDMFVISGKTKKNNAKELQEAMMLQEIMLK